MPLTGGLPATQLKPCPALRRCCSGRLGRSARRLLARGVTPCASASFARLQEAEAGMRRAPPSEKLAYVDDVRGALEELKGAGAIPKWGAGAADLTRRSVALWELKQVGVKVPESIGNPTVRDDKAFLFTVVGVTSVLAVAGQFLPGDWGFFVPYLTGGISIAVLAIGSTSPGLLQFFIGKFASVYPDYRERVLGHEAAHFLAGYLMGVPVAGYSLDLGRAHTDFAQAKLQRRLVEGRLSDAEVDSLAVVSLAGAASEAQTYEEVTGQNADLTDLQKLMLRSEQKLSNAQQQNLTRFAVYEACRLLNKYRKEYDALKQAMQQGRPVSECIQAIEGAGS